MFSKIRFPLRLLAFALLLPLRLSAQIYADVQVAGAVSGTFTITLEHVKTPGAVANFIGLATGQRGWMDQNTGVLRRDAFYNGVIFHRVVANFVSQTGSRNGLGTDGPGYSFRDEIDATLSHVNYAVAMANSGKHTNGSQFYICKGAQTGLDGGYTIFGLVTAGQAVCDAINATPVSGSTPVVPITIQSVTVRGPSLAAFNLDPAWLPNVRNARPSLQKTGAAFSLGYDHQPYSEYSGWHGPDMAAWTKFPVSYAGSPAAVGDIDVTSTATGASHFYRLARVDYSAARNPFMPASVGGKTLTFTSNFPGTTLAFNATGSGGNWTIQTNPVGTGAILAVTYTQAPYLPSLFVQLSSAATYGFDIQLLYKLNYTSATGGTFTAQSNASGYGSFSGTFTSAP